MTLDDAEAFAVAQGWPRFRGEQIWRWVHDKGVAQLRRDDEPVARRARAARRDRDDRRPRGRRGPDLARRHAQAPPRHPRRPVDRERADPRRRQDHAVHLVAGRLRGRLPVLRDREAGPQAQPRRRRDRRSGLPRAAAARRGRSRAPDHEPRLHGHGRAAPQLRQPRSRRCGSSPTTRASGCRSAGSRCRRRGSCPSSSGSAARTCGPNLAVSLNAPNDAIRDEIMPINRKWNIAKLLGALRAYPLEQRRRITFEYVLLAGVNDSLERRRPARAAAARHQVQGQRHPVQPAPRGAVRAAVATR